MEGRIAIVTGGSRDIGRQASLKLAAAGAKVCVNYFGNKEMAEETIQLIKDAGGEAIAVHGDMKKAEDVQKLVDACVAAYGDVIHVLVNVAGGLMGRKVLADLDEAFWDSVINVNLKSVYLVSRAVTPHMTEVRTNVAAATPLRREGRPEEIGDLVLYLASDSSSFINGESIEINGGTYFV